VVVGSSIGASPGDGSLVGGDGGCGMNGSPGGVLKASLYRVVRSSTSADSNSGKSMFMGGNSPVSGDIGSSVSNGKMSSIHRTSGSTVGLVGLIGATGAVLICDAISGDAVVGVVGVSSMGDAALGGMTGAAGGMTGAADAMGGATGATGGMAGAAGGTMGTTVGGAGGAAVMGSDG